ncbi:hypothetical protein, partial [Delftia acidovorans]|uniref:hypothetical protein n=1 Tax=Delftia acidovorans TaxID=80866 RepID=UPI00359FA4F3
VSRPNFTLRSLWGHSPELFRPKRFSSLPLFIRFGMLRNFFMPAKRPPIGWPFLLPLQLQLSLRG